MLGHWLVKRNGKGLLIALVGRWQRRQTWLTLKFRLKREKKPSDWKIPILSIKFYVIFWGKLELLGSPTERDDFLSGNKSGSRDKWLHIWCLILCGHRIFHIVFNTSYIFQSQNTWEQHAKKIKRGCKPILLFPCYFLEILMKQLHSICKMPADTY